MLPFWKYLQTISIHALREEGDSGWWSSVSAAVEFLSTPSARRATRTGSTSPLRSRYFYPRPPRGGRRGAGRCT